MIKLYPLRADSKLNELVDCKGEGDALNLSEALRSNEKVPPLALSDWNETPWGARPGRPTACLLRVYVVRAFDLQPRDPNGLADPFVELKMGPQRVSNRSEYQRATLDPVFGK